MYSLLYFAMHNKILINHVINGNTEIKRVIGKISDLNITFNNKIIHSIIFFCFLLSSVIQFLCRKSSESNSIFNDP